MKDLQDPALGNGADKAAGAHTQMVATRLNMPVAADHMVDG